MTETERELRMAVALMMLFYLTQALIEALIAAKVIPDGSMSQSLAMAHDAWLLFFGMVSGIFRGMMPTAGKPVQPGFGANVPQEPRASQ